MNEGNRHFLLSYFFPRGYSYFIQSARFNRITRRSRLYGLNIKKIIIIKRKDKPRLFDIRYFSSIFLPRSDILYPIYFYCWSPRAAGSEARYRSSFARRSFDLTWNINWSSEELSLSHPLLPLSSVIIYRWHRIYLYSVPFHHFTSYIFYTSPDLLLTKLSTRSNYQKKSSLPA